MDSLAGMAPGCDDTTNRNRHRFPLWAGIQDNEINWKKQSDAGCKTIADLTEEMKLPAGVWAGKLIYGQI